jgi:hypothetical protein
MRTKGREHSGRPVKAVRSNDLVMVLVMLQSDFLLYMRQQSLHCHPEDSEGGEMCEVTLEETGTPKHIYGTTCPSKTTSG